MKLKGKYSELSGMKKQQIYLMPFNKFLSLLQTGERAILYLKLIIEGEGTVGGHVVYVKKEFDNKIGKIQYTIFDNNQKTVHNESDFIRVLRGEKSFLAVKRETKKLHIMP